MEFAAVQFSFAINQEGQLTHITEVDRDDTYRCCGCNQKLIPVLGESRLHHFRHGNISCSSESYLHMTAKLAFYQGFKAAIETNQPIKLELERLAVCQSNKSSLLDEINVSCHSKVVE